VAAALTPVPFYPFKFLSIASKYSQIRYLAALFSGLFPRYSFKAAIGNRISIPNWILLATVAIMFIPGSLGIVRKKIRSAPLPQSRSIQTSESEELI